MDRQVEGGILMTSSGSAAHESMPTRTRRRLLLAGAGAAAVGGTMLAIGIGTGPGDPPAPSKDSATVPAKVVKSGRANLELFDVTRSDFEITTTATGELRAKTQIEILNTLE